MRIKNAFFLFSGRLKCVLRINSELILNAWRVDSQQALISEPVQQGGDIQTVSRAVLGKYLREGMKCIDRMHFPRHIATVWT